MADAIWVWRHPKPVDAAGRCIGIADLPVDPRKSKRLAERIRRTARRHGLPHHVVTSPLRRAADVGRWLQRWGWRHDLDAALMEMDFGRWNGRRWVDVPMVEFDAWCADFVQYRPGGGEPVGGFFDRVAAARPVASIVVSHGGWMVARRWLADGSPRPMRADQWPAPPAYAACWRLPAVAPR